MSIEKKKFFTKRDGLVIPVDENAETNGTRCNRTVNSRNNEDGTTAELNILTRSRGQTTVSHTPALRQNESPSGVKSFQWAKGSVIKSQINRWIEDLINETDEKKASAKFRNWLDCRSKFPRYSLHNSLLILMQCPHATMVAGARTCWVPKFGRYVKRDEWKKPIRILAPMFKKKRETRDDGTEKDVSYLSYFRTVDIYDVSQTEGKPMPEMPSIEIDGDSLIQWHGALQEFLEHKGIKLDIAELRSALYGYSEGGRITVNSDKSVNTQVNTLLHEIGHEILHPSGRNLPPEEIRELQAESFAYIVGRAFGFEMKSPEYFALRGFNPRKNVKYMTDIANSTKEIINFLRDRMDTVKDKGKERIQSGKNQRREKRQNG